MDRGIKLPLSCIVFMSLVIMASAVFPESVVDPSWEYLDPIEDPYDIPPVEAYPEGLVEPPDADLDGSESIDVQRDPAADSTEDIASADTTVDPDEDISGEIIEEGCGCLTVR